MLKCSDKVLNNKKYVVAIIGSGTFVNYLYAKKKILEILEDENITPYKIVSGGAVGSDKIAETFAEEYNINVEVFKPDWSIGKHAGLLRNTQIIENCDYVIAFWDMKSKGTLDSINKAKKLNKSLYIVDITENKI